MILFLNIRHKYNNKNHKMFLEIVTPSIFFTYFAFANHLWNN